MTRYRAPCPYCEAGFEGDTKQTAKRARYEHVRDEHADERGLNWHRDMPDVRSVGDP